MQDVQQPLQQGHVGREWYYYGPRRFEYKRRTRRLERQSSARYYTPAAGYARSSVPESRLHRVIQNPYTNDVLLFRKLWSPKHWANNLHHTEDYFDGYFYANRYQDACYIGIILLHHFILLLRPEDENERKQLAIHVLPKNITGKICPPEGDLLLIHRRVLPQTPNHMPASLNYGLPYLAKVMKAVNLLPGPHITPPEKFGESQPSHLRDEQPSSEVLASYSLPGSSNTHDINFYPDDLNLSSLSMFFKPLFTSKYIFLESEKTRYTVETLQLAFVAFKHLADTALWSEEYAYALYLIQNMYVIVNHMEILLPVPKLQRYYTYTTTCWYFGRIYCHLAEEQDLEWNYRQKYDEIYTAYESWSDAFYSGLEKEIEKNMGEKFLLVDRSEQFQLPGNRDECLLLSYDGYFEVQIPLRWKRSLRQQNFVTLHECHQQLKGWSGSLISSATTFSFQENKRDLYKVLYALCSIHSISLDCMSRVSLALLKAKCLYYLSILDVSQLINWCSNDISDDTPLDAFSFESILCFSEIKLSLEDCEIYIPRSSESLPPDVNVPPPDVNVPPPDVNVPPPDVNVPLPDVNVPLPDVNVPPPDVNVPPPDVNVPPPDVNVPPPDVNVPPPDVNVPPPDVNVPPPDVNVPPPEVLTPEEVSDRSTLLTRSELRSKHFQDYLNSPEYTRNLQYWSEENSKQLAILTEAQNEASTAGVDESPAQPDRSPAQPDRSPAQPDRSPAQPDRSPAQPDRSPAQPDRSPAQPDRSPAQPDRSPAQPDRSPAQPDRSPAQPDGSPVQPSPVSSGLSKDIHKKAIINRKAFEDRPYNVRYQISNVPVAVSNMLKANEYRLEGSEFMDTRKSIYLNFSDELFISTPSNIMVHYIHLQEYETDPKFVWQMTRDFANLLDKWFPEKKRTLRFHNQPLTRVDYPMLNRIFTFMFMGGCLSFYFLYRLQGERPFYNNARYFYAMMTLHVIKYDLWEPVLNSLAEHVEMRQLLLLDCHEYLWRQPDRCVAVIRSYLHMLPLLYELCILKQTKGGPTNCERLRVNDVAFPFNIDAVLNPDEDTDVTLKILRKAKNYLRKRLGLNGNEGIITALDRPRSSNNHKEEILEYCKKEKVDISRTVPNYPALERWSWEVPERDTRPMCTGDDDCASAPCPVEEYIDEEEKFYVDGNIVEEPEFLNELSLNMEDSDSVPAFPNPLTRLRMSLNKVVTKLEVDMEKLHKFSLKEQYVRVCIPGVSSVAGPSRTAPNERREDLTLSYFKDGLTRSKGYLSDDFLDDDLALCKALVCLDKLLNQQFRISHFLRGSITDLDDFLHGEEELFETRSTP